MNRSPPLRVLVTRSEPGASETTARLREIGFEAAAEPLFAIVPIDVTLPDFGALAFTSANGVRRFALLSPRRDVPVWCVGGRTAQTAREAGFADVRSAEGDVNALAALIGRELKPGVRLLHAGNEDSRGDLVGRLCAAGHQATFLALFRAAPAQQPGPRLAAALSGLETFDAVMIHSPRAGIILAGFAAETPGRSPLKIVAISQAAAEPLLHHAEKIEVAATPDEAAMVSALARLVFG